MGSKNNPGAFDCYANAHPDEPMFVLMGRDPMAADLIRQWALWREAGGENPAKVAEARTCANNCDAWCRSVGREPATSNRPDGYLEALAVIRAALDILAPLVCAHREMMSDNSPGLLEVAHRVNRAVMNK